MDKKRPNLFWGVALILIGGFFLAMNVGLIPQLTENTMNKMSLVAGILFIVLALVVFVFADGPRRWYSGLFFAVLGVVMLARWRRAPDR